MNTNTHNASDMTVAGKSTMTPAHPSFGDLIPPPATPNSGTPTPPPAHPDFGDPISPPAHLGFDGPIPPPAHPGFGGLIPPPAHPGFGGLIPPPARPGFGGPIPPPAHPGFGGLIPPPAHPGFGGPIPPPAYPGFGGPIPPHMRNRMIHLNFDGAASNVLKDAIGDEDTAQAAVWIIQNAPPEIQVCAAQLLMLCGAATIVTTCIGPECNVKFPSPAMNEEAQELYNSLYGDAGSSFVDILNTSPDEIAVLSRLIAYLGSEKKEEVS